MSRGDAIVSTMIVAAFAGGMLAMLVIAAIANWGLAP